MSIEHMTCHYKYIMGSKKDQFCGKYCRSGRTLCYTHNQQLQKQLKKKTPRDNPIEPRPCPPPIKDIQATAIVLECYEISSDDDSI